MNYTKPCGCKIYVDDSATELMELEYCPMHKAAPDMQKALKGLLVITKGNGKRSHHSLCYGLDIEAHPDCDLCKLIKVERIADKALAKVRGK